MAIVREMIRTKKKNLTIVASATAGLEIDLLIGAGCVKKLYAPYVGQEMYCPIGHNYRKYAECGEIEIMETSEYLLYAGFFAAASGQEFFGWRGGVGTSIPELNKELVEFIDQSARQRRSSPCRRCGLTGRSFMSDGQMFTAMASISARASAIAGWRAPPTAS